MITLWGIHAARSQPVLTAANYTVQPGESFDYLGCVNYVLSWDYSSETCWSPGLSPWADPAGAPGSANFPGATVAMHEPGSPAAHYFTGTPTDFTYNGYYGLPTEMEFCTDPMLLLQYPFTFGSTFTDVFHCERTGGVLNTTRHGTITVTGEAYGTLVLPWGTFTDCLRVMEVRDFYEAFEGEPDTAQVLRTSYFYIVPGVHRPLVVSAAQIYAVGGEVIENGGTSVMADQSTSVDAADPSPGPNFFPNPATDRVEVADVSGSIAAIELMDPSGRVVLREEIARLASHCTLDVSSLPAGAFLMRVIRADGSITIQRLLVARP